MLRRPWVVAKAPGLLFTWFVSRDDTPLHCGHQLVEVPHEALAVTLNISLHVHALHLLTA
jgi:hypothetical protein